MVVFIEDCVVTNSVYTNSDLSLVIMSIIYTSTSVHGHLTCIASNDT